jgi:hypothetical protein
MAAVSLEIAALICGVGFFLSGGLEMHVHHREDFEQGNPPQGALHAAR